MRSFPTPLRWLVWLVLIIYFTAAAAILVLRYGILPYIDTWRPQIQEQLSRAMGMPITMSGLQAEWKGLNPAFSVTDLKFMGEDGSAVFDLPSAHAELKWLALLQGRIQFSSMQANGLELSLRRDEQNNLWFLGRPLNLTAAGSAPASHPALRWLLSQGSLALTQARLRWDDESRDAPALQIDDVSILFQNKGQIFQASIRASAPGGMAQALTAAAKVRFDQPPSNAGKLPSWQAHAYVNLQRAIPKSWAPWFDVPSALQSSEVSSQWWLQAGSQEEAQVTSRTQVNNARWLSASGDQISASGLGLYLKSSWSNLYDLSTRLNASGPQVAVSGSVPERNDPPQSAVQFWFHLEQPGVDLPNVFSAPLVFDTIESSGRAELSEGALKQVTLDSTQLINDDMDVTFAGDWFADPASPFGQANLKGRFVRASLSAIHRYLPQEVDADAREWLSTGLVQGQLHNADFLLEGELEAFPFGEKPDKGRFYVGGPFEQAIIDYAPASGQTLGWPRLQKLNGLASLNGVDLRIQGDEGEVVLGDGEVISLHHVVAQIPDIEENAVLTVQGRSQAPASAYLALNRLSPLSGLLDHALDLARAQGSWQVPIWLNVPLYDSELTTVSGSLYFNDGTFRLEPEMPGFSQLGGRLDFTETGIKAQNVKAVSLGGALTVSGGLGTPYKGLLIQGQTNSQALSRFAGASADVGFEGATSYRLTVRRTTAGRYDIALGSDLKGMRIDLPAPLNKGADEPMQLQAQWQPLGQGRAKLGVKLGQDISMDLRHDPSASEAYFSRVQVALNQPLGAPEAGLNIDIRYPYLNLDTWLSLLNGDGSGTEPGGQQDERRAIEGSRALFPELNQLRIQAERLQVQGVGLDKATLTVKPLAHPKSWRLDISSTQSAGTLWWRKPVSDQPATVEGKFARLSLGSPDAPEEETAIKPLSEARLNNFKAPNLSLDIKELVIQGRLLGAVELEGTAQMQGRALLLDQVKIQNAGSVLDGKGQWRLDGPDRGLSLNASMTISDFGRTLNQIGMKDVVAEGQGYIEGTMVWNNFPWRFEKADINGQLNIQLDDGRFSSVNSRSARVLELLSLQSIRRILSFETNPQGAFSQGFPFDRLEGSVQTHQGVMSTNNFRVNGPVGSISLGGDVDLVKEMLDLQAMVVPNLDMSGASVAASIINPIVGVGAFLTQWLLRAPLSKAMTVHYNVTGSWSDPRLEEVDVAEGHDTANVSEPDSATPP